MKWKFLNIALLLISSGLCLSQSLIENNENISLHFQQTIIAQGHPSFNANYTGANSLQTYAEAVTSLTTTMYLGVKLIDNLNIYLNPEITGGAGISGAVGIAGFSNGETFRIGNSKPTLYPARMFIKYTLNLDNNYTQVVNDDLNQIKGKQSENNITFIAGKFGIADYFDTNLYSHDPRTQFFNWSLMNSGAWDYPADTRGYTWGVSVSYNSSSIGLQFAIVTEPTEANGLTMDDNISKAHGIAFEIDKNYTLGDKDGTVRLLLFYNKAKMGSYAETLNTPAYNMDVTLSDRYSRTKYGFALNVNQKLSEKAGGFLRLSWNDGQNETWAFTEIDRSVAIGSVINGIIKGREADELGAAFVINGISDDHKNYLAAGGYGFLIGDGKLHYGLENIFETYYKLQLIKEIALTFDYQFVVNPAYNMDRGPVHIWGIRMHTEI